MVPGDSESGKDLGIPVGSHLPGTRGWMLGSQCAHASGLAPGTSHRPAGPSVSCVCKLAQQDLHLALRQILLVGEDLFFFLVGLRTAIATGGLDPL